MGQPGRASAPPARQPRGSVMVIGNRTTRGGRAVSACRVFVVAAFVAAAGVGRAADGPVQVAPLQSAAGPGGRLERFFCAFHNALCCPDPCYEPRWVPTANAALFVDFARPATLTRLRWDSGVNLIQPDRSEFFWAAQGRKGPGSLAGGRVVNPETGV